MEKTLIQKKLRGLKILAKVFSSVFIWEGCCLTKGALIFLYCLFQVLEAFFPSANFFLVPRGQFVAYKVGHRRGKPRGIFNNFFLITISCFRPICASGFNLSVFPHTWAFSFRNFCRRFANFVRNLVFVICSF